MASVGKPAQSSKSRTIETREQCDVHICVLGPSGDDHNKPEGTCHGNLLAFCFRELAQHAREMATTFYVYIP